MGHAPQKKVRVRGSDLNSRTVSKGTPSSATSHTAQPFSLDHCTVKVTARNEVPKAVRTAWNSSPVRVASTAAGSSGSPKYAAHTSGSHFGSDEAFMVRVLEGWLVGSEGFDDADALEGLCAADLVEEDRALVLGRHGVADLPAEGPRHRHDLVGHGDEGRLLEEAVQRLLQLVVRGQLRDVAVKRHVRLAHAAAVVLRQRVDVVVEQ